MSTSTTTRQKRSQTDVENQEPNQGQRKRTATQGGGTNKRGQQKPVSDLVPVVLAEDKEKDSHDKADGEVQLPTKSVLEEIDNNHADKHDDERSSEDDDSSVEDNADGEFDGSGTHSERQHTVVDVVATGTGPPSRDHEPFAGIGVGREGGTAEGHIIVQHHSGRPPFRGRPLSEVGRGGHEARTTGTGGNTIVHNGRPLSRNLHIVDGGHREHVGTGWSGVNHRGPPPRGQHPTGGNDGVGDQVGGGYSGSG